MHPVPTRRQQAHPCYVKIFLTLKKLRMFERRHLPLLQSLEDLDIICEIGYHQEAGTPVALKHLIRLEIGSVATVNRRVKRLKGLGLVREKSSRDDGRVGLLTLSPGVLRAYARMERLLAAG